MTNWDSINELRDRIVILQETLRRREREVRELRREIQRLKPYSEIIPR